MRTKLKQYEDEGYVKDISKLTFKFKSKHYSRPLILSYVDYNKMFIYDFKRLNPNIDYDEFWNSL
jgi:hypothetical protein